MFPQEQGEARHLKASYEGCHDVCGGRKVDMFVA